MNDTKLGWSIAI